MKAFGLGESPSVAFTSGEKMSLIMLPQVKGLFLEVLI